MKRTEYMHGLRTHSVTTDPLARFLHLASELDTKLEDLNAVVNLYEDCGYCFRILDKITHKVIAEKLNPAYANAGDYRQIVMAVRQG